MDGLSTIPCYRSKQLRFLREVIEPLASHDCFRVITPKGTFQFTRAQFEEEFANVVESSSYRDGGVYHYPITPERALKYLISGPPPSPVPVERLYAAPPYVLAAVDQAAYSRWLHRKAMAHVIRDRRRWSAEIRVADYKKAIHEAVMAGDGCDPYTGEKLDWHLIGTFNNVEAKGAGSGYKRQFRLLPTVDHLDQGHSEKPRFQICSWEVNDAKSDLTHEDFLRLCRRITEFEAEKRNRG